MPRLLSSAARAGAPWTLITIVAGAAWGCVWVVGCAAGEAGGGGAGVGASGNSGGGGAGAGSTTSTTSGSGGTGAGTTSSTTSSGLGGAGGGGPCTEDPCRLAPPQCGCPQGQKCTFHPTTGPYCVEDGTISGGAQCLGSGCEAGYICVGYGDPPDLCRQFCNDDSDCDPPGGVCVIELGSGGASATLCSDACDPVSSVECTVAGTGCVVLHDDGPPARDYTQCVPAGSAGPGQPCSGFGECQPGTGCFTSGSNTICLTYCNRSAPQCPGSGSCNAITPPAIVGGTEYGVCQ